MNAVISSYLYSNVIHPLAWSWRHSTLVDAVKDNVILFAPVVRFIFTISCTCHSHLAGIPSYI